MESYGLLFSALMLVAFLLSAWGGLAPVEISRGDKIRLYYNLKTKYGSLVVFVKDPQNRIIWQKTFNADTTDTINLRPKRPGNYQLIIGGNNTGGGFDIQWNFDEI